MNANARRKKPPRICYACKAHGSKGIKCRECERPACIHLIGHVLRPDPQDSSTWNGLCHSRKCKDAVEARYLAKVRSDAPLRSAVAPLSAADWKQAMANLNASEKGGE